MGRPSTTGTRGSDCASSVRRFTFSTRTDKQSTSVDTAEETISMKALTEGRYRGRNGSWAVFDLGWETELRVGILEQDIGRVVMKRDGGYRLDRGWSIAPNGLEPPYEGRSRDSTDGFACPEATVSERDGAVVLAAAGLSAVVTLSPFGIAWHRAGEERPF